MTGPSAAGSVVLDLGPGVGALVLYAPAEFEGTEIEISPGGPDAPAGAGRTHARVRRRHAGGTACYAAVYQALAAGPYVVWRDRETPAGTALITGGEVTSLRLRSSPGGRPGGSPSVRAGT